ncbi:DUF7373 family lipoprotein [Nocardia terpenica]|uniref:DUF7373 family lipoprotein n=1 Tax=Nocardia terpenica TaxID=455432 RepID=UPI001EEA92E5|nr:hypothetical protein [Nocardia terpenica]
MSAPNRFLLALLTAGLIAAATSACGSDIPGTPVRQTPDLSQLDVGNYQVKPRILGHAKSLKQARVRESQRLADYVALPSEADPTYTQDALFALKPHIVLNRKALGDLIINDTFDDVAKDLVAGWQNAMGTATTNPGDKQRLMNLAVLEFPDATTAATVGPTLEHDDFTYNPDNQPVPIPKYPDVKSHWRPTISSIGAWAVHDRYVVFMKVTDDTSAPDLPALVSQVERLLDVQFPLLDKFTPTPADALPTIPLDPDDLLGHTLPTNPEEQLRADPDAVYTGRGAVAGMQGTSLDFLKTGDLDQISFGDGAVFRSRTTRGARQLWQEWKPSTHPEPDRKMVSPPKGLGDNAECFAELTKDGQTVDMNLCIFQVDRYVVQTAGKQLQDLHQKTAAQYQLLVTW